MTVSSEIARRSFVASGVAIASLISASMPAVAAKSDSVVQKELNSFVDLIYNFRNTALDGGLDASKLKEPSIPFIEFGEKMKNGDVTFVEFIAPTGAVAYATFKVKGKNDPYAKYLASGGKQKEKTVRLRIGQGYPTGGKNSWSSPDYVIRSVSNFGVPYKFTVPALSQYKNGRKSA